MAWAPPTPFPATRTRGRGAHATAAEYAARHDDLLEPTYRRGVHRASARPHYDRFGNPGQTAANPPDIALPTIGRLPAHVAAPMRGVLMLPMLRPMLVWGAMAAHAMHASQQFARAGRDRWRPD